MTTKTTTISTKRTRTTSSTDHLPAGAAVSSFLMPVEQYMSAPVHAVAPDTPLPQVYERLLAHRISSLAVVDGGKLVGVVSRSDLLRVGSHRAGVGGARPLLILPEMAVAEAMSTAVVTVAAEDALATAARRMVAHAVHRVFVLDGHALAGVLGVRDVMQAIREQRLPTPIHAFMTTPVLMIGATEPVWLAVQMLERARISGVVVVEDDWPVGVFTQVQALAARDYDRETPVEEVMDTGMVCMPSTTRMHRAAAQAVTMRVRRIIVCEHRDMLGILSGLDFAKAVAV
jgi:CBS domain-containing protein